MAIEMGMGFQDEGIEIWASSIDQKIKLSLLSFSKRG
jgi:hypothetical protein